MSRTLVVNVHLHEARYHGVPDWPPAPARLFQALVAGAAEGDELAGQSRAALEWLEQLPSPIIAAPIAKEGRGFVNYVPNNDLDAKNGDPARLSEVRAPKLIKPRLLEGDRPILYFWDFEASHTAEEMAGRVCLVAERLFQLGRGVDIAWAWGEVLDDTKARQQLTEYRGIIHHPCGSGNDGLLFCPDAGSLQSLVERYHAHRRRLTDIRVGTKLRQVFAQPPKPRFRLISYNSPPNYKLYDLVEASAWPLARASELVTRVRDASAKRLTEARPMDKGRIERVLIGRGTTKADGADRVRILPIPSIGHRHADSAIRRVLVEIPASCPIHAEDIAWGLSGPLSRVEGNTADTPPGLVPAKDLRMLRNYGVPPAGEASRCWQSVTPAVVPEAALHPKMDCLRRRDERNGSARIAELDRAAAAVLQALRHANIRARVSAIRVQREPFDPKGARAEAFCPGTRFARERLWHVQITFAEPMSGPLIIGDGRYAGLGLMAPVREQAKAEGIRSFAIVGGLTEFACPIDASQALRRAVMARAQTLVGHRNQLPTFFTGHEPNGAPARNETHRHLAFVADLPRNRLLIVAPHVLERRLPERDERRHFRLLEAAISNFTDLRAGSAGRLTLAPTDIDPATDRLLGPSQHWESVTEYHPTRYAKRSTASDTLSRDIRAELRRLEMPAPIEIDPFEIREGPRGGLVGRLRLQFATSVPGLILLGRSRHFGGGLFRIA
jgi:CRISPR-associated protein Csb2